MAENAPIGSLGPGSKMRRGPELRVRTRKAEPWKGHSGPGGTMAAETWGSPQMPWPSDVSFRGNLRSRL